MNSCRRVCIAVVLVMFIGPNLTWFLPAGGHKEQPKLDRIVVRLRQLEAACDEPKLKDVLQYTISRYSRVGRGSVAIRPLAWFDACGLNCPWAPGITIDASHWKHNEDCVLMTIVHEAMHDYYPFIGHYHMWGTVPAVGYDASSELEQLLEDSYVYSN